MTMPMIRLELEGLRYQVIHALTGHQKEIQEQVDEALKKALEQFNFEALVRDTVNRELGEAIKKAFTRTISEIVWAKDVREIIQDAAKRKVRAAIEEAIKE